MEAGSLDRSRLYLTRQLSYVGSIARGRETFSMSKVITVVIIGFAVDFEYLHGRSSGSRHFGGRLARRLGRRQVVLSKVS